MIERTVLISVEINELKSFIKDAVASSMKEEQISLIQSSKDPKLLSREEVMELFDITAPTIREWSKKGILPKPIRRGRRVYFLKNEIYKVLKDRTNAS